MARGSRTGERLKRSGGRLTTRRAVCAALLAVGGATLAGLGATSVVREELTTGAYANLGRRTSLDTSTGVDNEQAASTSRDWEALRAENPAVAAWMRVGGTCIDLPVVATADESEEEWYLHHDLWGGRSASGTPFLDHRVEGADGRMCVAYGHHMTSSSGMFSELRLAHEPEAFGALGELVWETPTAPTRLAPLMAVSVDQTWADIQVFDWTSAGDDAFRAWLAGLCAQASAHAPVWESLVGSTTRCVSLVTCSSAWANQPWRTVCLWCA